MRYDVKFAPHKALAFYGRGIVQLHETGLVVEGDYPKFTIPFVTSFYAPLLCASTTRTVPYSRISGYSCTGNWFGLTLKKVLFIVLFGLMAGAGSFLLTMLSLNGAAEVVIPLIVVWVAFVFVVCLLLFTGGRTHQITYHLPTGRRQKFKFKLRPATVADTNRFKDQLRKYMASARESAQRQEVPNVAAS